MLSDAGGGSGFYRIVIISFMFAVLRFILRKLFLRNVLKIVDCVQLQRPRPLNRDINNTIQHVSPTDNLSEVI